MTSSIHVKTKSKWKTVEIPPEFLQKQEFGNLIEFQELTDYEIIKETLGSGADEFKKHEKKNKTKKQKNENQNAAKKSAEKIASEILLSESLDSETNQGESSVKFTSNDLLSSSEAPQKLSRKERKQLAYREHLKMKKAKSSGTGFIVSSQNILDIHNIDEKNDLKSSEVDVQDHEKSQSDDGKKRKRKKKQSGNIAESKEQADHGEPSPKKKKMIDEKDAVTDMGAWKGLFVPTVVLKALKEQNFTAPTPIQALTLPSAIRDRMDIIGAAETGSGKTLAFGIPVINAILKMKESERINREKDDGTSSDEDEDVNEHNKRLYALILTPTRELAIQIKVHLEQITKYTDIKAVAIVGGMAHEKQQRLLKRHPEIVIATPGRLWELKEDGDEHLSQIPEIPLLVIDEADRMVEKGHFQELSSLLEIINSDEQNKKKRQNFVFSATLTFVHAAPQRLAFKKKKKKINMNMTSADKVNDLVAQIGIKEHPKIVDLTKTVGTAETLIEARIGCTAEEKDIYLYYFLKHYPGRTLIFTNSKDCLRRLISILNLLNAKPLPLHAEMHQKQRLKNLERFTSDPKGLLLATDVAARGLDIPNVQHVIHYQVPKTTESYIHRSGRTARASKEGLSVMLVGPDDVQNYRKIIKALNKDADLPVFPVEFEFVNSVKERVSLARKIDVEEHRFEKKKYQNNWFEKAAKEADLEIDDEHLMHDLGDYVEQNDKKRKLNNMKKELEFMLKQPLNMQHFSGKYPTMSGKLKVPEMQVKNEDDNALKAVKNIHTKKNKKPNKKFKRK